VISLIVNEPNLADTDRPGSLKSLDWVIGLTIIIMAITFCSNGVSIDSYEMTSIGIMFVICIFVGIMVITFLKTTQPEQYKLTTGTEDVPANYEFLNIFWNSIWESKYTVFLFLLGFVAFISLLFGLLYKFDVFSKDPTINKAIFDALMFIFSTYPIPIVFLIVYKYSIKNK
jgi:hypothetical protein